MNTGKALLVALAMSEKTKKELAESMGLSVETVYSMCRAKSATTDTMKRAADALGMKLSDLVALGEDR